MALVFSLETGYGITCAEAYLKVDGFNCRIEDDDDGNAVATLHGHCLIYADAAARNSGASHISGASIELTLDLGTDATHHNPVKQLYLALKAGDYSGSTDA